MEPSTSPMEPSRQARRQGWRVIAVAVLLAAGVGPGCDLDPLSDGLPDGGRVADLDGAFACTSCHGSDNPAPPRDVLGRSDPRLASVGAHQRHYAGGTFRLGFQMECKLCHPAAYLAEDVRAHIDGVAEVAFRGLAVANGARPSWDPATLRCSGTYCHGATLDAGGTNTAPAWTTVDGTQGACGTCHAVPPPPPHPVAACSGCHPQTVTSGLTLDLAGGFHIDGILQAN